MNASIRRRSEGLVRSGRPSRFGRAGRACGVPRYARGVARFEHVPPGERTPDPRPGDFILTHGGELFSRLIQIGQQLRYAGADQPYTYWNHSALIVSNDGALVEAL